MFNIEIRAEAHRICKLINKHLSCDFENYTLDQYSKVNHDWSCDSTCEWLMEIDKAPISIMEK